MGYDEIKTTLDIRDGLAAYISMGDAGFPVLVNGHRGKAITIPGHPTEDLVIVVPAAHIEEFLAPDPEGEFSE